MHWWDILLFIVGAPLGAYLWCAPPKTMDRHLSKLWKTIRSKQS